jgi:hypothetical protein
VRLAQHVAAAPHGFDEVAALGVRELLAQLADEDIDDLQFGLVRAAIQQEYQFAILDLGSVQLKI